MCISSNQKSKLDNCATTLDRLEQDRVVAQCADIVGRLHRSHHNAVLNDCALVAQHVSQQSCFRIAGHIAQRTRQRSMKRSSNSKAGRASKRHCTSILVVQLGSESSKSGQAALWQQGLFCDVQLRVGNEVFQAHRLVLAGESQFLAESAEK